jgi:hypothetical protein
MGPLGWGPLTPGDGSPFRAVIDGDADLFLRHAPRGAVVTIEYQSDADALVTSIDGSSWALPAAPDGSSLSVELPPGVEQLTFAAPDGELRVMRLALEVPQD